MRLEMRRFYTRLTQQPTGGPAVFGLFSRSLKHFDIPLASAGEDRSPRSSEEDVMIVYHRFRTFACGGVLVALMACFAGRPASAQECKTLVPRVRSDDPSITKLIEQAMTHSPTFKRLIANIEASNGIVYVQSGSCPGRVVACLPIWMASSGGNRFMRIIVDRERIDSDWQLLGAIGHELQHAIEVLRDRFVTNSVKMYYFYRRYAPTAGERFETPDAARAGMAVEEEWRRSWR
jgi:hypothetical protein